ncbi:MAG: carbohydrate porin [Terriglobales bacterium]
MGCVLKKICEIKNWYAATCLLFIVSAAAVAWAQESPPPNQGQNSTTDESIHDSDPKVESMFPHFEKGPFWISGQMNFIFQTHPGFPAKYSGQNSLNPHYEKATSRLMTLYTALRFDDSTEVLLDIEESGQEGLSSSLGVAGFPNLDVVRNPSLSKAPYIARVMIDKVFSFGGQSIENERGPLSVFDELPARRLEIHAGKFSMVDFFDLNSVGSDSHLQFENWAIDNNGAYDYAADTRGYTWGMVADYEDRNWGLRFAEALMPKVANGIDLVWNLRKARAENVEFELRYGLIPKKSGIVRLLGFSNHANMGVYRDAVAQFEEGKIAAPDITAHPFRTTQKYGFGINIEQSLTSDLVAFARWGWNNGRTESFAYTEIDSTFVEGLGVYGSLWHRKQDRAGIAFDSSAISKDHQSYLAQGGYGFIIGDGALNYGRENILETYYTAHVWRGIYVAPGLQHINNPAYNRDRGPVIIPTFRVHVEY